MNHRERARWDALIRRRDWLEARIGAYTGKDMSRDKHELSALKWIMEEYTRLTAGEV